jgi:hypothetical protein
VPPWRGTWLLFRLAIVAKLVYLIGEPAAGKSTLMKQALEDLAPVVEPKPLLHTWWDEDLLELGGRRSSFSGTDAMPMNIQPRVVAFLQARPCERVIAEGDRLANGSFFKAVTATGYDLTVVWLWVPPEIAAERRRSRAKRLGVAEQNATWVKGRQTKVNRLGEEWAGVRIDGTSPIYEQVDLFRSIIAQADPSATV